jgi:hypothetical protein
MLRRFRAAAVAVFISLAVCAPASAQVGTGAAVQEVKDGAAGSHAALIKEQARKMSQAFLAGDFETLLDATYPKILELSGGRAKMLEVLKAEVAKWEAQKIKILSYEAGEPGEVKSAGAKLVSVVPAELKMEFPDLFFTQKSFMLAISADGGKAWKFVSGANLNEQALKVLVPEAVGVITLPKAVEPVIEKKP